MLDLVDEKKIAFQPAVKLSYLKKQEQEWLLTTITSAMVELIMSEEKEKPIKVTLSPQRIKDFFPKEYDKQQIEKVIFQLLTEWKRTL